MSFKLEAKESVANGIKRIAHEQLEKAIKELTDNEMDKHEVVHQVRKRCKKLRGLIRLTRPAFEKTYSFENAWYRDAARRLSYLRDTHSIIETFDGVVEHFKQQMDYEAFTSFREHLVERRDKVSKDEVDIEERLNDFSSKIRAGKDRVDSWELQEKGFDAVAGGLYKTYARGCKAMQKAYDSPSTENFHEWRKRTKYHWYHARLLKNIWEDLVKTHRNAAHKLSNYLGDEHDLAILREKLLETSVEFGNKYDVQAFLGLIDRRRLELQSKAKILGLRLYCEDADRLVERFGGYWKAWQDAASQSPVLLGQPVLVDK